MQVTTLRTNYMENPMGFDFDRPQLSWVLKAEGRDRRQTAYRLQVALEGTFSAPILDSGKVMSTQSVGIRLEEALSPRTRYHWRVMAWDEADCPTPFSETAFFETGRYDEAWDADWIGGEMAFPQLRAGFRVEGSVKQARAYASGVGLYSLFLNGQPASSEVLTPGFNAYDQWIQYQTYDITPLLAQGDNAVGAWLGSGYYMGRVNFPGREERRRIYGDRLALICEIIIDYADGTQQRIATDAAWRASESPFLRAEIYDGEVYDARLEQEGFSIGRFDDSAWAAASLVSIDKALLTARRSVPVIVTERIAPPALIHTPAGETVLDFGQNFAGWVRFATEAPAGTEIWLQFGEALDRDGNFYRENMRTALAELRYIAGGRRREYAPTFTFFGFRYVKVSGWPGALDPADFTGEVVHSGMERTGWFECSDARVNRLYENALWGQRSNFVDVPTDCPQRDERMGWTGDAQVFAATACLNMQADAFYRKYLYDLALEQHMAGYVPVVVPNILAGSGLWELTTTGWGDAATIIPWTLYLYYGDVAVLEAQYESMKDWVDYMQAQDTLGVDRYYGFHLGDWLAQDTKDPDNHYGLTPTDLLATAYYAHSAQLVAKAARVLGREADAKAYAALSERIRKAFRDEYVTRNGRVVSETQTAQVIALAMDLLLPAQRPVAAAHLAERIRIDRCLLTTGFLGTPYLCPTLSENGLNAYAYALLLATECPSWLYAVEKGATTIWERWNSIREDGTFGPASMNSLNHYAFGAIAEWMYRYAAGINPVEEGPGFARMRLMPMPNSQLSFARAEVMTPYGLVRSGWQLAPDGTIALEFEVPCNATAEIHLPDADGASVLENGVPVEGTVLTRGSGTWRYAYRHSGRTIDDRVTEIATPTI